MWSSERLASLERRARSGGVRADFSGESLELVEVAAACWRRGEGCPERERRISWSIVTDLLFMLTLNLRVVSKRGTVDD